MLASFDGALFAAPPSILTYHAHRLSAYLCIVVPPGLQAAIDSGDGSGGDWRRAKKLPGAFWSPSCKPGCFVQGDGSTSQYGDRTSELVRFIRNLWQHFADQRAEVQRAIVVCGAVDEAAAAVAGLSVEEQEVAVARCFLEVLFPSLLPSLRRAEAEAETSSSHSSP